MKKRDSNGLFTLYPSTRRAIRKYFNLAVLLLVMVAVWGLLILSGVPLQYGVEYLVEISDFEANFSAILLEAPKVYIGVLIFAMVFSGIGAIIEILAVRIPGDEEQLSERDSDDAG